MEPRPDQDLAGFRHERDENAFQGHLWRVVKGTFRSPAGETFHRDIVRSPGAVAVVPILVGQASSVDVVLLKQYRAAFDEYVLEIPAGMRDVPGEPLEEAAQRELLEETGYRARSLDLLHSFYPSPGMTDAVLHIFLGTSLQFERRSGHGPEELDMEVLTMPLRDAVEMALEGRIKDAKSVIGLLLAERSLNAGKSGS